MSSSVSTWHYLNPFYQHNDAGEGDSACDGESVWTENYDDSTVGANTIVEDEDRSRATSSGSSSGYLDEQRATISIGVQKQSVLKNKTIRPKVVFRDVVQQQVEREPENFLTSWFGKKTPKSASDKKQFRSRFVGRGLPAAPSGEEGETLMYDLPRPPSLVYEYEFAS